MQIAHTYNILQVSQIVAGQGVFSDTSLIINNLAIDSRILVDAAGTLFFAIKGKRDGHLFIDDAYKHGVRNFVVSDNLIVQNYPGANFLSVTDTVLALQKLAAYHRAQFNLNVIGITGSNGKTIVKEWLYQLLVNDFTIVKSPKSFNSQLGVPLSVWQINQQHTLGIFEAGISTKNEMDSLAKIIMPTLGILTNIKQAHDEGFEDKTEKLLEKLKLFEGVSLLVYSPDYVPNQIEMPGKNKFTWSFNSNADLQIIEVKKYKQHATISAKYNDEIATCEVPFTDDAAIENAVICWSTLLAMGVNMDAIVNRLSNLTSVGMRLQLLNGVDNCSIIDDSYSADISSLAIALDFLNQQNQHTKRTVILSDLYETGKSEHDLYTEISSLLKQKKIDKLIGVGQNITAHKDLFSLEKVFFSDAADFLANVKALSLKDETILVKGARKAGFEDIVKRLAQKIHDTVLEINLNALLANLQFYNAKLAKGVKTMAMVKAYSYGSGSFEIANLLQYQKVDYLTVAYADEGVALRKAGIKLPIMVMSPEPSAFDAMLRFELEPEIYSLEALQSFINTLPNDVDEFKIHIKLDTGMHRLGFEEGDISALKTLIAQKNNLKIVSVFTHLVGSDDEKHDDFTLAQINRYAAMYNALTAGLQYKPLRHVLNTSGITRWSKYQFDMVRVGIGLYGFDAALKPNDGLQTVAALKTTVSQVKQIKPNDTVGYSRNGKLPNGGQIATVKIGYADGYNRAFGNGVGKMIVGGKLVPTIGSICMDMCMLDVTGLTVNVGDEVVVFNHQHTIADLAAAINTIPYEILTSVSHRVKRIHSFE